MKSKELSKAIAKAKVDQAMGAKVRRKHRAMVKQADRQLLVDRRTKAQRGYDACVLTGLARAQVGTCIATIVSNAT